MLTDEEIRNLVEKLINKFVIIDTNSSMIIMDGKLVNAEELSEFIFYALQEE